MAFQSYIHGQRAQGSSVVDRDPKLFLLPTPSNDDDSEKQHNTELVVGMVRQQFKKHVNETDPEKIQKLKDDAARGLINHMLFESAKLTGDKVSQKS